MYKKRQGTSAVHGHLYETKLLSLILFRAQHDNNIKEFYLATNISDIGAFDDICFKAKFNRSTRPLVVFTQAKHSKSTIGILNKKNNLLKYFNSYMKIKNKFNSSNKDDHIFNEQFNEIDCYFVVYTIAKNDGNFSNVENPSDLNSLIATGPAISQRLYNEQNLQLIAKLITASSLAQSFAKFLHDKYEVQCNSFRDLTNDLLTRYHVILAKEVVDVSEVVNKDQRKCKFRDDFFVTTDVFLSMFRDNLYLEILKQEKLDMTIRKELLKKFLAQPSEDTLRPVIGRIILFDDGKFEFVQKHTPLALREELRQIHLPHAIVKSAIRKAALHILQTPDVDFLVPSSFGNIDFKEKNLSNLTVKIRDLLNSAADVVTPNGKVFKLVSINEEQALDIKVLNRNLGSTVGNLLICADENGYFKFTESDALLKPNARTLLRKLKDNFPNLKQYRIEVKILAFPKLTYDLVDEGLARDFLSKLVLYSNQATQYGVESILKDLIQTHQISNTQNFRLKSEAIFLKYHDKIQTWWISSAEKAPYLTKEQNIYQETVDGIVNNPLMTITNMVYMNSLKSVNYKFNGSVINSLSSSLDVFIKSKVVDDLPGVLIVTDSSRLTVTKITNILRSQYIVLDFNYVTELLPDDYYALIAELDRVNIVDTFILVCDLHNFATPAGLYRINEKLKKIVSLLEGKKKIIITNESTFKTIAKYFPRIGKPCYETNRLVDFLPESQKLVLENCDVLFQDQNVNLSWLLDNNSLKNITGNVLNEVVFSKHIVIGDTLAESNYDTVKHLYVERRLCRDGAPINLETLQNVKGDVVLLTGKPGMGKSTLLTHLSLKTKQRNKRLWIAKINLLDHSKELRCLQKKKTAIDILDALKFMCYVVLKIKKQLRKLIFNIDKLTITLNKSDDEVYIDTFSGDQWSKFELQMFIHFYNKGNVVFLFDGFDEICPHYKETVLNLVNILRNNVVVTEVDWSKLLPWPQVWITSRAYNELQLVLEEHFSTPYELENFSFEQLSVYLDVYWESNLMFSKFSNNVVDKIQLCLDNTSSIHLYNSFTLSSSLSRVYSSFISYLITNFPEINGKAKWYNLYRTIMFLQQYVPDKTDTAYDSQEVECPLLTSLLANYFVTYLQNIDENDCIEDLNINPFDVYKWLIEALIQKYYKDKKKMDLDITYNIMDYESKLPTYMELHKKIAAYAIFRNDIHDIFDEVQISDIKFLINTIKKGEEVTGVTCSVLNDIPQFVNMTFAQYLATEFLFDLLKNKNMKIKRRRLLNRVLYNQVDLFCVWLSRKLETDEHFFFQVFELRDTFQELEHVEVAMVSTL